MTRTHPNGRIEAMLKAAEQWADTHESSPGVSEAPGGILRALVSYVMDEHDRAAALQARIDAAMAVTSDYDEGDRKPGHEECNGDDPCEACWLNELYREALVSTNAEEELAAARLLGIRAALASEEPAPEPHLMKVIEGEIEVRSVVTADHAAIRARLDAIWLMAQDAISNIDQPGLDAPEWEYKARGHVSDLYALGAQSAAENEALLAVIDAAPHALDCVSRMGELCHLQPPYNVISAPDCNCWKSRVRLDGQEVTNG